jgi:hypothetical protein
MNIKQNWDNSKLASYLVYDNWQPRKAMLVLAGFQMLDEWNNVDTRFALDPKSFDIPFDEMIAAQEEMNEKLKRLLDILDSSNLMYSIKSPAYFISWSISKNSPPDWLNWAIEKKLYTPDAPIKNEDLTFDKSDPKYPVELDFALQAWKAISSENKKGKPKARARDWLDTNTKLSNQAKERISTVVNWDKTGGATKT